MPGVRPRTSIVAAWIDGWRRVVQAPMLVAGMTLALAFALELSWQPQLPAWAPGGVFGRHVGWIFGNEPYAFGGLATFIVNVVSLPRALRALYWDHRLPMGATFLGVVPMLLAGGAIDRLARMRRVGAEAFIATTGALFLRFLRLGVILGGVNWMITRWILPWARDVVFAAAPDLGSNLLLLIGGALLFVVAFIGDYAQVRCVVEDRRSVLSAVGAAVRFIRRRPLATVALYTMSFVPAILALWLLSSLGTSVANTEAAVTIVRWLFVLVAVVIRLGFMATAIAVFQQELAHVGYTARPVPTWPDSPAVEAIAALDGRTRDGRAGRPLPL
jgi:hypothetical protein